MRLDLLITSHKALASSHYNIKLLK